jgi:hypothetical protein
MGQIGAGSSIYNTIQGNPKARQSFEEAEKTFSAFSGADIVAYMGHKRVASLQGITVSITREVMPVFVMGDPNPKAFVKGKRAIAGNLVFTQFDKHAILKMSKLLDQNVNFIGDIDYFQIPDNIKLNNLQTQTVNVQSLASQFGAGGDVNSTRVSLTDDAGIYNAIARELAETYALVATRRVRYSDQVPPFDVTITMVNELGQVAYTAIHNVQLVNEGWGYTLDDLNSEAAFTFVARAVSPLDSILNPNDPNTSWNDSAGDRIPA